jgi:ribonucleoside-triphosphate reductase
MPPKFIKKRDGTIAEFNPTKIKEAVYKAAVASHIENPEKATEAVFGKVMSGLEKLGPRRRPEISDIESNILSVAENAGYTGLSRAYQVYRDERTEVRKILGVKKTKSKINSTDAALLIESDSKETVEPWDRMRVKQQLQTEANLSPELAGDVAKDVENMVIQIYKEDPGIQFTTTDIRAICDLRLRLKGLEGETKKQKLLGMPTSDLEGIIYSRSNENSNVATNNPEAVNLEIAERIQKQWALETIFTPSIRQAHLDGRIHLHDLGYPNRVYCSSHSLEYFKKYGLNKLLSNLESKSNQPNSAAVLNQHVQTALASMQMYYAGALGFGFLNIFYSSLLNRPVDVVTGKISGVETKIEKRDLEKLVEQGVFTTEKPKEGEQKVAYFEKISERKELREVSGKDFDQTAQNLIFAASQNAFSRGGQTLFIDFNIHTGVPGYMKNVPAVGPGGRYMVQMPDGECKYVTDTDDVPRLNNPEKKDDIKNGDVDDSKLTGKYVGGKIITYGMLEKTSQKFAKSLLNIWRKGDKDGRPFHFPKCDLHVDKNSFEDTEQKEVLDLAHQIASENGSVYFMYDRGDGAVLAQCCRLKERIEDTSMLKYPERLRFCGFQNVTINLAQAAYRGKNLEGTLKEVDSAMELAFQAHLEKQKHIQKLLDTDYSPLRGLGKPSDDGNPYIDLKKSTYIIGNIGLNETVQHLTGKQLHEGEDAYRLGLTIIAHMYKKIQEFKAKSGLKFTIEETPAESTTRRLAKVDLRKFEEAKKVVRGTLENPYYTNSVHFSPDADVGLVDRIEGQSRFHDMIESGAIVHGYLGEKRPSSVTIEHINKKTLYDTRCSQLVFSPTYTECDECGNIMPGEKKLCTN